MSKVNMPIGNDYCPQSMFVYGTYNEDGKANFALFNWFSYTWDSEMGVMACIGGSKRTRDNILRSRTFSANLVTEKLLPLADYLGNTSGYDPGKMAIDIPIGRGNVLDVPTLIDSPLAFELEVNRFIPLDDGLLMLCRIRNVLADELLADETLTPPEKLLQIRPIHMTCNRFFGWDGSLLGSWGEPMKEFIK